MAQKTVIAMSAIMFVVTGTAMMAGRAGVGAPKPVKNPISIREGSVRDETGRNRTRYFVGGGIHRGK